MNTTNSLYEIYKINNALSDLTLKRTTVKENPKQSEGYDISQDVFFNIISHELRTPINVVLGSTQLFEMMGDDLFTQYNRNKFKVYNTIMMQNCYRLLRSVNNLIDVSKLSSGNLGLYVNNCEIVGLVKDIVSVSIPYAKEKDLTIKFSSDIKEIVIPCDKDKLSRVMFNLISNAIKFTPQGGNISIHLLVKSKKLCISVQDTGIGIPEDNLDNIFNRFVQVDKSLSRNHEGCGIGLSIVKFIVNLHKGDITVRSKLGKGSTFLVKLPLQNTVESSYPNDLGTELHLEPKEMVKIELSDLY